MSGKNLAAFSEQVEAAIVSRDEGLCARCLTPVIHLMRGFGWSLHHRMPRGRGGTRRAFVGQAANGVLLCGSGVTGCHGWVEAHRREAIEDGFIVSAIGRAKPDEVEIFHALHGRVLLLDEAPWVIDRTRR